MAHLDEDHGSLRLDLRVPRAGPHALVFFYHSLDNDGSVAADLVLSGADRLATGRANFHHCNYNLLCRQVRCTGCFASAALCTLLRCCVHPTHSMAWFWCRVKMVPSFLRDSFRYFVPFQPVLSPGDHPLILFD